MEKDILRKIIRQMINEIYEQLQKELLNSEQTSSALPGSIEEQLSGPEIEKNKQVVDK